MRTHIRMHINQKSGDINEENYISCILDDNSTEIPPAAANKTPSPNTIEATKNNCVSVNSKPSKTPEIEDNDVVAVDTK
jgi:hypothetical protein